jgi:2'-5' RNA ligase
LRLKLFVAIDLDDAARDVIADAIDRLRAAGVDARFQPREKWHTTVAYLGDTDAERLGEVATAVRAATAACGPFDVVLDSVGAFPDVSRPRVVWVGSATPQPGYASCSAAVRGACQRLGFHFEHDDVPHVTVCRLKRWRGAFPAVALPKAASVHVESLILFESVPDGPTTRYEIRERIGLQPPV